MIDNVQSLKDKSKNFAKKNNLEVQTILQNFMFERFLERLSKSKYKDNFILKGGFLLSSIMGINIRATMDIDANITGMDFNEKDIKDMIKEIASIKLDDHVTFDVEKDDAIREDNEYGGYSFKLIGHFFNITIPFSMDISTGDIITPRAIEYQYKTLLDNEYIDLITYNYETIIAEKLQTVLERGVSNSRMKDYYDLYYFAKYKWNEIDSNTLEEAIKTTFEHRNSIEKLNNFDNIINAIENSEIINKRWKDYQNKSSYAKNINFDAVMIEIKKIKNIF